MTRTVGNSNINQKIDDATLKYKSKNFHRSQCFIGEHNKNNAKTAQNNAYLAEWKIKVGFITDCRDNVEFFISIDRAN